MADLGPNRRLRAVQGDSGFYYCLHDLHDVLPWDGSGWKDGLQMLPQVIDQDGFQSPWLM